MRARLVVNADDFGLTEGTNRAIVDAHCEGIVTSTSLLANGPAFDHAVALSQAHPSLGVGVHLTLTEGPTVADNVPELLDGDSLPLSNQPVARALVTGRLPRAAIEREFTAQVEKVLATGIQPTHLDGHKYIHLLPGITPIVRDLAYRYNIPVVRIPRRSRDWTQARHLSRWPGLLVVSALGMLAARTARRGRLKSADRVAGFVDTGHLSAQAIRRLLAVPRPGVTELVCHPAYRTAEHETLLRRGYAWIAGYDFDGETAAVRQPDLRRALLEAGWVLCHFGQIGARDGD